VVRAERPDLMPEAGGQPPYRAIGPVPGGSIQSDDMPTHVPHDRAGRMSTGWKWVFPL